MLLPRHTEANLEELFGAAAGQTKASFAVRQGAEVTYCSAGCSWNARYKESVARQPMESAGHRSDLRQFHACDGNGGIAGALSLLWNSLTRGEVDRIWQMIFVLRSGVPS